MSEEAEGAHLESSSSLGIILEVKDRAVQFVEQFSTDLIVTSLTEVHSILEVSATQVNSDSHVFRAISDAVVVKLDVGIKDRFRVDPLSFHSCQHIFRALQSSMEREHQSRQTNERRMLDETHEISEKRVVELDIPASSFIQILQFLSIRFGDIGEIF